MKLKKLLTIGSILTASLIFSQASIAQWAPKGPIKIQVGFGSGGITDTLGRAIASSVEKQTGWDVIVENKPGGGGVAMFSKISRSKADGQLIGLGVNLPILMNLVLRGDKLPFKADSFDYLATITVAPISIIARADAPFNTFAELVEYSKNTSGVLVGFDAKPQEMILRAVNKQHSAKFKPVTHKSGAEVIQSLLGGHVLASYGTGAHIKYINSGDFKMLAVATSTRQAYSPETKTLREQGYDYSVEPYFYFAAPKGLKSEVKSALETALDKAISSDEIKQIVVNSMFAKPINLGASGTQEKLFDGVKDITALINANK